MSAFDKTATGYTVSPIVVSPVMYLEPKINSLYKRIPDPEEENPFPHYGDIWCDSVLVLDTGSETYFNETPNAGSLPLKMTVIRFLDENGVIHDARDKNKGYGWHMRESEWIEIGEKA